MMRSLLSVSLLIAVLINLASCSPRISNGSAALPPPIEVKMGSESQRYNIQLDFMKHHFSGMLIVRRLSDNEIRILASTYFGLSLFDFSLSKDTFRVNSCLQPMRKEKVLKLLEMDFRQLFLSEDSLRANDRRGNSLRIKEKSSSFEKRVSGRGFGKSVISISGETKGNPTQVRIKHPWIRLTIQLDKLASDSNHS